MSLVRWELSVFWEFVSQLFGLWSALPLSSLDWTNLSFLEGAMK